MRRRPSWSQKLEARIFPENFCTRKDWVGEPLLRNSIDFCFVFGSLRYKQVSSMVTNCERNYFNRDEKIPNFAQTPATLTFLIDVQAFRDTCHGEFWMLKSSEKIDPTILWEMQECSAIDITKTRQSSKISCWICQKFPGGCLLGVARNWLKNHRVFTRPHSIYRGKQWWIFQ
jgi:hypothetical protein